MRNIRTFCGLAAIVALAAVLVFLGVPDASAAANELLYVCPLVIGAGISDPEIKKAFGDIGEALEAFKKTHEEELKELKKGVSDPVLLERLGKIEGSLDKAVEAKAGFDAAIAAEKKEREELEAKINRMGIRATSEEDAKRQVEMKEFNTVLAANAADRKRSFEPFDEKGLDGYKAALDRFMRSGPDDLSADEKKTLSVGFEAEGGYFVTPDTTGRIVKKVYETSPMRQVASAQTISTDKLEGIEDLDEAGANYAGERSTSGNTKTADVGKWSIPVWWIDTEPKATQQILDDAAISIEAWHSGKVGDKLGRFENAEFVAGSRGKIRGFTSYDTAEDSGQGVEWGKIGIIKTGVNGGFPVSNPADKLLDLMGLLKGEYLNNARWMARRSSITAIRKFKDGMGNYIWQPSFVLGQPETIWGHAVTRAEDMPAHGATGANAIAFGDFAQGYQIVDRMGIRVIRDNVTEKPFVKFYTAKRTGGGVVNFEAIKLLKFAA